MSNSSNESDVFMDPYDTGVGLASVDQPLHELYNVMLRYFSDDHLPNHLDYTCGRDAYDEEIRPLVRHILYDVHSVLADQFGEIYGGYQPIVNMLTPVVYLSGDVDEPTDNAHTHETDPTETLSRLWIVLLQQCISLASGHPRCNTITIVFPASEQYGKGIDDDGGGEEDEKEESKTNFYSITDVMQMSRRDAARRVYSAARRVLDAVLRRVKFTLPATLHHLLVIHSDGSIQDIIHDVCRHLRPEGGDNSSEDTDAAAGGDDDGSDVDTKLSDVFQKVYNDEYGTGITQFLDGILSTATTTTPTTPTVSTSVSYVVFHSASPAAQIWPWLMQAIARYSSAEECKRQLQEYRSHLVWNVNGRDFWYMTRIALLWAQVMRIGTTNMDDVLMRIVSLCYAGGMFDTGTSGITAMSQWLTLLMAHRPMWSTALPAAAAAPIAATKTDVDIVPTDQLVGWLRLMRNLALQYMRLILTESADYRANVSISGTDNQLDRESSELRPSLSSTPVFKMPYTASEWRKNISLHGDAATPRGRNASERALRLRPSESILYDTYVRQTMVEMGAAWKKYSELARTGQGTWRYLNEGWSSVESKTMESIQWEMTNSCASGCQALLFATRTRGESMQMCSLGISLDSDLQNICQRLNDVQVERKYLVAEDLNHAYTEFSYQYQRLMEHKHRMEMEHARVQAMHMGQLESAVNLGPYDAEYKQLGRRMRNAEIVYNEFRALLGNQTRNTWQANRLELLFDLLAQLRRYPGVHYNVVIGMYMLELLHRVDRMRTEISDVTADNAELALKLSNITAKLSLCHAWETRLQQAQMQMGSAVVDQFNMHGFIYLLLRIYSPYYHNNLDMELPATDEIIMAWTQNRVTYSELDTIQITTERDGGRADSNSAYRLPFWNATDTDVRSLRAFLLNHLSHVAYADQDAEWLRNMVRAYSTFCIQRGTMRLSDASLPRNDPIVCDTASQNSWLTEWLAFMSDALVGVQQDA